MNRKNLLLVSFLHNNYDLYKVPQSLDGVPNLIQIYIQDLFWRIIVKMAEIEAIIDKYEV